MGLNHYGLWFEANSARLSESKSPHGAPERGETLAGARKTSRISGFMSTKRLLIAAGFAVLFWAEIIAAVLLLTRRPKGFAPRSLDRGEQGRGAMGWRTIPSLHFAISNVNRG